MARETLVYNSLRHLTRAHGSATVDDIHQAIRARANHRSATEGISHYRIRVSLDALRLVGLARRSTLTRWEAHDCDDGKEAVARLRAATTHMKGLRARATPPPPALPAPVRLDYTDPWGDLCDDPA